VVINVDDPLLTFEIKERAGPRVGFGVAMSSEQIFDTASSEPEICPRCGNGFDYTSRTIGHLGRVSCSRCGLSSGNGGTRALLQEAFGLGGIQILIDHCSLRLAVGGIHSAYNAAAAVATAKILGVPSREACSSLESFVPRFGRDEVMEIAGRSAHVLLMKNPVGANAVFYQASSDPRVGAAVLAVNDNAADGRDVSWIWDADFEFLVEAGFALIPSGKRAADVAVRIKYAGGVPQPAERNVARALRQAASQCRNGQEVVVLATYTAMLELRRGTTSRWHRRVNALQ
jgi:UDP-N-acetylmuramyl tripeptide synthase